MVKIFNDLDRISKTVPGCLWTWLTRLSMRRNVSLWLVDKAASHKLTIDPDEAF
jgi:hypothetical protein